MADNRNTQYGSLMNWLDSLKANRGNQYVSGTGGTMQGGAYQPSPVDSALLGAVDRNASPATMDYIYSTGNKTPNANVSLDTGTQPMPSISGGNPDTTLGLSNTTWGGIGQGLQIASGLAQTAAMYDQLAQNKKAFEFNKGMKEKEYAMAKDAYDKNVARSQSIGEQMRSRKVGE